MAKCTILQKILSVVQVEGNSAFFDYQFAPFSQRGGLGKAHQLFGEQLPLLLEELNEVLAA